MQTIRVKTITRNIARPLWLRFFASPPTIKGPSQQLKSWESGARAVKNTQVENQYLEHIREVHDPSSHLKTIEDELKGTIGQALGKQGQKVLGGLQRMEAQRQVYLETGDAAAAQQYNEERERTLKYRWELIVHRQAVGFTVGNHSYVLEKFPIPEKLAVGDEDVAEQEQEQPKEKKKKFGDQLDWWQRVGRWR
uniref:Uncharacterized protein n=1 Tax=Craspedostauros australis TaxID=1486917 RepID=A0A7R9ZS10_9STRA